jgi:hypothetical protein
MSSHFDFLIIGFDFAKSHALDHSVARAGNAQGLDTPHLNRVTFPSLSPNFVSIFNVTKMHYRPTCSHRKANISPNTRYVRSVGLCGAL